MVNLEAGREDLAFLRSILRDLLKLAVNDVIMLLPAGTALAIAFDIIASSIESLLCCGLKLIEPLVGTDPKLECAGIVAVSRRLLQALELSCSSMGETLLDTPDAGIHLLLVPVRDHERFEIFGALNLPPLVGQRVKVRT